MGLLQERKTESLVHKAFSLSSEAVVSEHFCFLRSRPVLGLDYLISPVLFGQGRHPITQTVWNKCAVKKTAVPPVGSGGMVVGV